MEELQIQDEKSTMTLLYNDVLQNPDLLSHILTGRIGAATFVAVSCVCREWRRLCLENEKLILSAVAYSQSVSPAMLMRMFHLSAPMTYRLPDLSVYNDSTFPYNIPYAYGVEAAKHVLKRGGMKSLRKRIVERPELKFKTLTFLEEVHGEENRKWRQDRKIYYLCRNVPKPPCMPPVFYNPPQPKRVWTYEELCGAKRSRFAW